MQVNSTATARVKPSGALGRRRRKERGVAVVEGPAERLRKIARSAATYAKRLNVAQTAKLERGCVDCGYRAHPAALDFDHLPGAVKIATVGQLCRERASIERIMAEIAKCEVVCANCHRIRTYARRQANAAERDLILRSQSKKHRPLRT